MLRRFFRKSLCKIATKPVRTRLSLEALENHLAPSAGALDPTFGNGAGYVTTALNTSNDWATSAIVQPDGKILAAGAAGGSVGLARYNPDGSLDTSFGTGGKALGPTYTAGAPQAAVYPSTGTANDGKIVVSGYSFGWPASPKYAFSLARFNANGTLDTSFGTNGTVTTSFGSTLGTRGNGDAIIQTDGKIVAIGASADGKTIELARYNANGTLDATFGHGGLVTTPSGGAGADDFTLLLQPNGGIIATMEITSPVRSPELIGYNANGSLNTSFGSGGFVITPPFTPGGTGIVGAALYSTTGTANDGKIVVTGNTNDGHGTVAWFTARYNPNGTLDSTFGMGGAVITAITPKSSGAQRVAIQPDGKLVVVGVDLTPGIQAVARYNTDGSLDSTFGNGGIVITPIGSAFYTPFVVLQPNGGIVVTGGAIDGTKGSYANFSVTRYLGDLPGFAVSGFPSSITAGTAGTFTVRATKADGSTNAGYTDTVHFTSSDPQAVLPADYTFTAADQGVHSFTVTLKTAGSEFISATDTLSTIITGSEAITVTPGAATHFSVSAPASVAKGDAFSITVTALDAYGNIATGYTGTVHFASSDSGAVLPVNYTFTAADAGVHTFTKLKLKTKGSQTLTVSDTKFGSIDDIWNIDVT